MTTRTIKQLTYGALYTASWLAIGYGIYVLVFQPAPSCTDNRKNQDEVEVDCGGQFCQSCEVRNLKPIEFSSIKVIGGVTTQSATVIVEMRNINATYGTPRLAYELTLYGAGDTVLQTSRGETALYPSELKYRLHVNLPVAANSITRAAARVVEDISWQPLSDFTRPKTPLRDVQTQFAPGRVTISGIVKNDNAFDLRRATVSVVMTDGAGTPLAASMTVMQDLIASQERAFQIVVPLPAGVGETMLAAPKISVDAQR